MPCEFYLLFGGVIALVVIIRETYRMRDRAQKPEKYQLSFRKDLCVSGIIAISWTLSGILCLLLIENFIQHSQIYQELYDLYIQDRQLPHQDGNTGTAALSSGSDSSSGLTSLVMAALGLILIVLTWVAVNFTRNALQDVEKAKTEFQEFVNIQKILTESQEAAENTSKELIALRNEILYQGKRQQLDAEILHRIAEISLYESDSPEAIGNASLLNKVRNLVSTDDPKLLRQTLETWTKVDTFDKFLSPEIRTFVTTTMRAHYATHNETYDNNGIVRLIDALAVKWETLPSFPNDMM